MNILPSHRMRGHRGAQRGTEGHRAHGNANLVKNVVGFRKDEGQCFPALFIPSQRLLQHDLSVWTTARDLIRILFY